MKNKAAKKLIAMFSAVTVMASVFGTSASAYNVQEEWRTYYESEGASYKTDVVYMNYNNPVTNYVRATSITGTSTAVVVTGSNVQMYDIPAGCYTAYAYTKVNMPLNLFRPYWKNSYSVDENNIGRYKCASSGGGSYTTAGYLAY